MSSCKGIVRAAGRTANVRSFIPPVQAPAPPAGRETPFVPKSLAEEARKPAEGRWVSLDQDEEMYRQASRIREGAKDEAREIIKKANDMAEGILRDARAQAEQMKKKALGDGYQEGFDQGRREGVDAAHAEIREEYEDTLTEFKQDMEQALASVREAKEECIRKYLGELKDCAVAVAEKVIHISLESSGEIIKRMILAETERLKKTAWVKIYMEKTDYEMMTQADADVIGELSRLSDNIKFVVMKKAQSGSCIIEVPDEIIDISVDTQMDNMREILGSVSL